MITFAIPTKITSEEQKILLDNLIHSIEHQSVKIEYEILVCGNYKDERVITLDFPEDLNGTSYITRKQNLLLDNAKYETIVFLRDYEILWSDWIDGYLYWNENNNKNWTIMMSPVLNKDKTRFRDVCHWDKPGVGGEWIQREIWNGPNGRVTKGGPHIPPYNEFDARFMYINGGYFIGKTWFIKEIRWNEELQWAMGEDVDISLRMRCSPKFYYVFNPCSIVQLQKQKDRILPVIPDSYFGTFEYIMSKYKR